jgi:hypothetical protein
MVGFIIMTVVFIIVVIAITWIFTIEAESIAVPALAFLVSGLVAGWFVMSAALTSFAEDKVVTCTVISKDRGGGEDGAYRVYTEECGVLANGDNPFWNKYNSADIWSQIPDEGPVTVHIVGIRNGFFSWFPNIIEVLDSEAVK